MSRFQTTPAQLVELAKHVATMSEAGLDVNFIANAFELARGDGGMFDLVALWAEADSDKERSEILADMQELLDDHADRPSAPEQKPYLPFDKLGEVAQSIRRHKKRLRELIEKHGGVSEVARRSGIPQPSLSRLLRSGSMPRRTTLYRIANALKIPESDVLGEWLR